MNVRGERFTVVGAGRSGLAAANILASRGADVRLVDDHPTRARPDNLNPEVVFEAATHAPRDGDVAVLSPGIKEVSPIRAEIASRASEVIGEVELFFRLCPAPVIAVTGTDGKSTVTTMLGAIMSETGRHTFTGGNLGNPLCEGLDALTPDSVVVAEISAFQLTTCTTFRPNVAVLTNIAEDHIDYHGTFAAYQAAKRHIATYMTCDDALVVNADDPYIARWTLPDAPRKVAFGLESLAHAHLQDDTLMLGDQAFMEADELQLLGRHNIANALAAAAAAEAFGVELPTIRRALAGYRALPHRLSLTATIRGNRWINDSKATNANAAAAGLLAVDQPVVLLAGGSDKQADFSQFGALIRQRCETVVLFGQTREQLATAIGGECSVHRVETLEQAVSLADELTRDGRRWNILLSPACASFDQFNSYAHRGEVFEALVAQLS